MINLLLALWTELYTIMGPLMPLEIHFEEWFYDSINQIQAVASFVLSFGGFDPTPKGGASR